MKSKYLLFLILISFMGCNAIYEDGSDLAEVVKKDITEISVDSLKALQESGEGFLLIDVRQPAEYEAGNIAGAVSIPRGQLEFTILDDFYWEDQFMYTPEKTDQIVIYCKVGGRGALATKSLQQLGFENVANLKGGYMAFTGGEMPVQKVESGGCGG